MSTSSEETRDSFLDRFIQKASDLRNSDEKRRFSVSLSVAFIIFVAFAAIYNFNALIPGKDDRGHWSVSSVEWATRDASRFLERRFRNVVNSKEDLEASQLAADREDLNIPEERTRNIKQQKDLDRRKKQLRGRISQRRMADVFRVTVANAAFVTSYCAILLIFSLFQGRETRRKWADSVYFYGFILTLISLILALGNSSRFSGVNLSLIVVQNAIALSSTVFALFLRTVMVLLIQAEEDNDDVLSQRIETLAEEFNGLSKRVHVFAETVGTVGVQVGRAGTVFETGVTDVADKLKKKAQEISDIKIDQEMIAKQMAESTKLAMGKLKEKVDALADALENGKENIVEQAKKLGRELDGLALVFSTGAGRNQASLSVLEETFIEGAQNSKAAIGTLNTEFEDGAKTIRTGVEQLAAKIGKDAAKEFKSKLSEAMDKMVAHVDAENLRLSTAITGMSGEINKLSSSVTTVKGEMAEFSVSAEALRKKLGENERALEALKNNFDSLNKSLVGTVFEPDWLENHSKKLESMAVQMASLRASLDETAKGFNSFVRLRRALARRNPISRFWKWVKG